MHLAFFLSEKIVAERLVREERRCLVHLIFDPRTHAQLHVIFYFLVLLKQCVGHIRLPTYKGKLIKLSSERDPLPAEQRHPEHFNYSRVRSLSGIWESTVRRGDVIPDGWSDTRS